MLDLSFVSFPLNFVNLYINLLVKTMSGIQLLGNTSIIHSYFFSITYNIFLSVIITES